ncbi:SIR2 family NAD-dependent protein deacylase [Aurantibacillus circumpalustris]|uniref:SIR2 family NAD-dependent protein deacylase n=1 Tax=Aurantibacillus circumpalustris TaxID=3036359 RepID=UPI00295BE0E8|nr:Sir2 family NAD-dependent protein deacetylase [Aurantibacillus circumpalustris]
MPKRKKLVVFTGAGISAESGIKTFRDSGGLWEEYRIEDVATFDAWEKNQELVLNFYNERRKQLLNAQPNGAHLLIADLQKKFDVQVITQNVDNLHERAGSENVLHLHGELMKARSTVDENLIYDLKTTDIKAGDLCEKGSQLRPHIVWFGELVPSMDTANLIAQQSDLFVVIGTSLNVYPAAGVINFVSPYVPTWLLDPGDFNLDYIRELKHIKKTAVNGSDDLRRELMKHL